MLAFYACVSHSLLLAFSSLRGMVVIKGRRPDGTVDNDGYDTGEESDEEEGQEVPLDGTKVSDTISNSPYLQFVAVFIQAPHAFSWL